MANDGFFHYQLSAYQKAEALVSLFVDPENPEDFIAGYVCAVNMRQAVLQSVSPVGRYDGLMGVRLDTVVSLMGEDEYAERLRLVLELRGEQPPAPLKAAPGDDLFQAMLARAKEEGRAVTVWRAEDEFVGFVEALDDMRVTLSALDFFGRDPQPETLVLRDIEMVSLGAEDELMYELLAAHKDRLVL